jgi:hypothetical protein
MNHSFLASFLRLVGKWSFFLTLGSGMDLEGRN